MNYPRILPFDELPSYPVRSFTYRNEQVRAYTVSRAIVYKLYIFLWAFVACSRVTFTFTLTSIHST
jgi:hypothetical protein